ncbi:hypothetical protein [Candidatus Berkiella aquae]|uniref:Uncharacterized protein n=1 Tax=Candidatus Berkiella aquae TaxID=295108 RepID=A0A0Q9Z056_9GAMM|nr:hypothetical protein [Candidatus Berkiella aquae]MCS5711975.1 hypothetical protein [Candidatus Berkiella aquae]
MRILTKENLDVISGGSLCGEAIIRDIENFDADFDPTQYCTKAQYIKYATALIDKIYEPNGFGSLSDPVVIDIIKSLDL